MSKKSLRNEQALLWQQEQEMLKWQAESRSTLYGMYKTLRDVGSTGDEKLDVLVEQVRTLFHYISERVMELNDEN